MEAKGSHVTITHWCRLRAGSKGITRLRLRLREGGGGALMDPGARVAVDDMKSWTRNGRQCDAHHHDFNVCPLVFGLHKNGMGSVLGC